ncbi:type II toxin-antitoxin system VapC family toxin [Hufsiella ginkgonis]|uniref:PIN domain-containing protein n=1 Tax=Hufsiella ginkgonis TaxID=2695274 RepID=A0A7K1XUD8_9SPHI|nr:type II toxin-antitoxin system VapC family toxin [Hufsiella ginkgonis]MXV14418.1 PIN domain-containing protein [Hufsiella ginkgonis]
MSGDQVVVDTSLIINLFNGVQGVQQLIEGRSLFVSVVSEIEVLSFPALTATGKRLIKDFLAECYVVDPEPAIKELTIDIRSKTKVKLPDAIIAATAIYFDLPLFTMDGGFNRVSQLSAVVFSFKK